MRPDHVATVATELRQPPPSEALTRFAPVVGVELARGATATARLVRYGVRVGGVRFLLREHAGAEVVLRRLISPLPNSPAWLAGLLNLRGNLVPIVDLTELAGLSVMRTEDEGDLPMLVLKVESEQLGLLLDRLPERVVGEMAQLRPRPQLSDALQEFVGAVHGAGVDVWPELDERLLFEAIVRRQSSRDDPLLVDAAAADSGRDA